jgi:hypothetical protein
VVRWDTGSAGYALNLGFEGSAHAWRPRASFRIFRPTGPQDWPAFASREPQHRATRPGFSSESAHGELRLRRLPPRDRAMPRLADVERTCGAGRRWRLERAEPELRPPGRVCETGIRLAGFRRALARLARGRALSSRAATSGDAGASHTSPLPRNLDSRAFLRALARRHAVSRRRQTRSRRPGRACGYDAAIRIRDGRARSPRVPCRASARRIGDSSIGRKGISRQEWRLAGPAVRRDHSPSGGRFILRASASRPDAVRDAGPTEFTAGL